MKVEFRKKKYVEYEELHGGEVFLEKDCGEIYIKLNEDWYANLENGEMYDAYSSMAVERLNATLYIE